MKISYHTIQSNLDTTRGYGAAGFRVVRSLQELGHEVPFDDSSAPVQISFVQPALQKFHDNQYKIGYTPWESTELPNGWLERFNSCDEVWATSPWVARIYEEAGVTKPIHVYKHGLDSRFEPFKRTPGDVVRFLHVGEPALRKGGQMALDAFRAVFGNRTDVHLTIKAYHQHYLRTWIDGRVSLPNYDNVTILTEEVPFHEMIELYNSHDVLVYPSYGEGFGFIPLQALGTGMPVISTFNWADYARFLDPLKLDAEMNRSIWSLHPGNVYYPDYDHLCDLMSYAYRNIESLHDKFYSQATDVHTAYNWLAITKKSVAHIVEKFS